MLQEKLLTTFVYSDLFRVLWCAEIAAVLTFWAFRGEINSCKGLTMTMAMRQPLIEHNSSLFEVLAFFYNHVWSNDVNAHTFWQHHFDSTRISQIVLDNLQLDDFCFQSRVAFFLYHPFLRLHYMLFLQDEDIPPCHSTWNLKISQWKRHLFWKLSFPASMLDFGGVSSVHFSTIAPISPIDITQK